MKKPAYLGLLVRLAVSASLLGLFLWKMDLSKLSNVLLSTNIALWVIGVVLTLVGVAISSLRWQVLINTQGVNERYLKLTYVYTVGIFFNNLLPTSVGGDVFRAGYVGRSQPHWAGIAFSILVERAIGLVALLGLGCLGVAYLLLSGDHQQVLRMVGPYVVLVFILVTLATIVLISPYPASIMRVRIWLLERPFLGRVFRGMPYLRTASQNVGIAIWSALSLSFLFQLVAIGTNYLGALALGVNPPLVLFMVFVPLVALVTLAPVSLNGIGVREGISIGLWTQVGISTETAFAMGFLVYSFTLIVGALGGIAFVIRR